MMKTCNNLRGGNMAKKYIVKQLNCDDNYTDYKMLLNDITENFNNDIFIGGNRQLENINYDLIDNIYNNIINYSDYEIEVYYKNNMALYIIDYIKDHKKISLKQATEIIKIIKRDSDKYTTITDILSVIYCKKYKYTVLHGYCQGDWVYCYYSSDIEYNFIQYIEAVLFNTGITLYISYDKIDIDNFNINNDDYDGYSTYIIDYFFKDEKIKEICDIIGCDSDEIAFFEITDIKKITTYKIEYTEVK